MRERPCPLGGCAGMIMSWMSTVVRVSLSREVLALLVHRVCSVVSNAVAIYLFVQHCVKKNAYLG